MAGGVEPANNNLFPNRRKRNFPTGLANRLFNSNNNNGSNHHHAGANGTGTSLEDPIPLARAGVRRDRQGKIVGGHVLKHPHHRQESPANNHQAMFPKNNRQHSNTAHTTYNKKPFRLPAEKRGANTTVAASPSQRDISPFTNSSRNSSRRTERTVDMDNSLYSSTPSPERYRAVGPAEGHLAGDEAWTAPTNHAINGNNSSSQMRTTSTTAANSRSLFGAAAQKTTPRPVTPQNTGNTLPLNSHDRDSAPITPKQRPEQLDIPNPTTPSAPGSFPIFPATSPRTPRQQYATIQHTPSTTPKNGPRSSGRPENSSRTPNQQRRGHVARPAAITPAKVTVDHIPQNTLMDDVPTDESCSSSQPQQQQQQRQSPAGPLQFRGSPVTMPEYSDPVKPEAARPPTLAIRTMMNQQQQRHTKSVMDTFFNPVQKLVQCADPNDALEASPAIALLEKPVPMERAPSSVSAASTQVATNRATDLAQRRIKEMEGKIQSRREVEKHKQLQIQAQTDLAAELKDLAEESLPTDEEVEEEQKIRLRRNPEPKVSPIVLVHRPPPKTRLSFGVPTIPPRRLEQRSILSVSDDESSRMTQSTAPSQPAFPNHLPQVHNMPIPTSIQHRRRRKMRQVDMVPHDNSSVTSLGRGYPDASSLHDKSKSSSVGVEVNGDSSKYPAPGHTIRSIASQPLQTLIESQQETSPKNSPSKEGGPGSPRRPDLALPNLSPHATSFVRQTLASTPNTPDRKSAGNDSRLSTPQTGGTFLRARKMFESTIPRTPQSEGRSDPRAAQRQAFLSPPRLTSSVARTNEYSPDPVFCAKSVMSPSLNHSVASGGNSITSPYSGTGNFLEQMQSFDSSIRSKMSHGTAPSLQAVPEGGSVGDSGSDEQGSEEAVLGLMQNSPLKVSSDSSFSPTKSTPSNIREAKGRSENSTTKTKSFNVSSSPKSSPSPSQTPHSQNESETENRSRTRGWKVQKLAKRWQKELSIGGAAKQGSNVAAPSIKTDASANNASVAVPQPPSLSDLSVSKHHAQGDPVVPVSTQQPTLAFASRRLPQSRPSPNTALPSESASTDQQHSLLSTDSVPKQPPQSRPNTTILSQKHSIFPNAPVSKQQQPWSSPKDSVSKQQPPILPDISGSLHQPSQASPSITILNQQAANGSKASTPVKQIHAPKKQSSVLAAISLFEKKTPQSEPPRSSPVSVSWGKTPQTEPPRSSPVSVPRRFPAPFPRNSPPTTARRSPPNGVSPRRSPMLDPSAYRRTGDNAADNEEMSVSVRSLMSAFESAASEYHEDDDDDTASVKSLRDKFEGAPPPVENEVGQKRSMFEAMAKPVSSKPFETSTVELQQVFSKFQSRKLSKVRTKSFKKHSVTQQSDEEVNHEPNQKEEASETPDRLPRPDTGHVSVLERARGFAALASNKDFSSKPRKSPINARQTMRAIEFSPHATSLSDRNGSVEAKQERPASPLLSQSQDGWLTSMALEEAENEGPRLGISPSPLQNRPAAEIGEAESSLLHPPILTMPEPPATMEEQAVSSNNRFSQAARNAKTSPGAPRPRRLASMKMVPQIPDARSPHRPNRNAVSVSTESEEGSDKTPPDVQITTESAKENDFYVKPIKLRPGLKKRALAAQRRYQAPTVSVLGPKTEKADGTKDFSAASVNLSSKGSEFQHRMPKTLSSSEALLQPQFQPDGDPGMPKPLRRPSGAVVHGGTNNNIVVSPESLPTANPQIQSEPEGDESVPTANPKIKYRPGGVVQGQNHLPESPTANPLILPPSKHDTARTLEAQKVLLHNSAASGKPMKSHDKKLSPNPNDSISGSEYSDGVTLDVSIADVSGLTMPTDLGTKADETSTLPDSPDSKHSSANQPKSPQDGAHRSPASSQSSNLTPGILEPLIEGELRASDESTLGESFFNARMVAAQERAEEWDPRSDNVEEAGGLWDDDELDLFPRTENASSDVFHSKAADEYAQKTLYNLRKTPTQELERHKAFQYPSTPTKHQRGDSPMLNPTPTRTYAAGPGSFIHVNGESELQPLRTSHPKTPTSYQHETREVVTPTKSAAASRVPTHAQSPSEAKTPVTSNRRHVSAGVLARPYPKSTTPSRSHSRDMAAIVTPTSGDRRHNTGGFGGVARSLRASEPQIVANRDDMGLGEQNLEVLHRDGPNLSPARVLVAKSNVNGEPRMMIVSPGSSRGSAEIKTVGDLVLPQPDFAEENRSSQIHTMTARMASPTSISQQGYHRNNHGQQSQQNMRQDSEKKANNAPEVARARIALVKEARRRRSSRLYQRHT